MPATFLDDGYTREAVIPESDRHPPVHIVYRPMLAAERRRLNLQTVRLSARGEQGSATAANLVVAALAARLVSWDVADAAGRPVDIEAEAIAALDPSLFEKIYAAVGSFADEELSAKN